MSAVRLQTVRLQRAKHNVGLHGVFSLNVSRITLTYMC